ncbi:hypothetical protein [Nocardioides sp. 1609]|uniref:hypothetical protein n=1 Tax=Nocardioides sp. 1609 TaxID=2508327 RepID=UPI0014307220|nr:hypothetical protein [Nocardioides sp. 1609]
MARTSPSRPREISLHAAGRASRATSETTSITDAVRLDKSGRYEIPVVRRTRVQARQQRLRETGTVLLIGATVWASATGVTWWRDGDVPVPVPGVRLDQPPPASAAPAVSPDRMSQTLAAVLPARVREQARVSPVSGGTRVDATAGAGGAPVVVRVGRVEVDDGTGTSTVRVEVGTTPPAPPCAAPCTISGASWTRAYRLDDVLVTVRLSGDRDPAGLDEAGRTAIAEDPVWLP